MKKPWLSLLPVVVFVAATAVATGIEERQVEPATAMRYFPCGRRLGCFSSISGREQAPELEPKATFQPFLDWEHPLLEEKPTEETIMSILQRLSVASSLDHRAKRNTRKVPPTRRRGKQRESGRPVCRGCYSGLTIVAPPADGGKNASLKWSLSESSEDSSGGN